MIGWKTPGKKKRWVSCEILNNKECESIFQKMGFPSMCTMYNVFVCSECELQTWTVCLRYSIETYLIFNCRYINKCMVGCFLLITTQPVDSIQAVYCPQHNSPYNICSTRNCFLGQLWAMSCIVYMILTYHETVKNWFPQLSSIFGLKYAYYVNTVCNITSMNLDKLNDQNTTDTTAQHKFFF